MKHGRLCTILYCQTEDSSSLHSCPGFFGCFSKFYRKDPFYRKTSIASTRLTSLNYLEQNQNFVTLCFSLCWRESNAWSKDVLGVGSSWDFSQNRKRSQCSSFRFCHYQTFVVDVNVNEWLLLVDVFKWDRG